MRVDLKLSQFTSYSRISRVMKDLVIDMNMIRGEETNKIQIEETICRWK